MKEFAELTIKLLYIYNLGYAFVFWGIGHGLLNIMIPYAVIVDVVRRMGKI